ncbi:hypothetical protein FRC12_011982 [Ceratobasidium sp. 428]|nr:hypothetical protein FRC12_011982 [Ceratobasidium sp. 428]
MPPKRANPSGTSSERPAKKAATGTKKASAGAKKASAPRLKKSVQPNWNELEEYSDEKPNGEWGKKCAERWCLLPPYNTSITEDQWKTYYLERSALDLVNSSGSTESKPIVSEELGQDTWVLLRRNAEQVAAAIFGSVLDDEHKKRIGRTMLGSLYFTDLWGNDEGDGSPREVSAKSRLYSPCGLGTSIDLNYHYHLRARMFMAGERFGSLDVITRAISDCDAENPRTSMTQEENPRGGKKTSPDATTVFDRKGSKSKGTTAARIKEFEEPLFGCEGWLSPLKLTHILFAAAGVMNYNEDDTDTPESTLAKFQFFQGEDDEKAVLKQELARLTQLEKELDRTEASLPQRLLLLARQEADAGAAAGASAEQSSEESKKKA